MFVDKKIRVADVIQVLLLIAGVVGFLLSMNNRADETRQNVDELRMQTTRIERYLSVKDPKYWEIVRRQSGEVGKE